MEKCLLVFTVNTNIFTLLYRQLKTDGKSFIFAVCRLPFDVRPHNVKLNLSNGDDDDNENETAPPTARQRMREKYPSR